MDASNQIQPTQTCTITPVFIHSQDGIAPFKVGTASYWTWEAAFRAAGAGQVTLADSYDLPTDLTGNLLEADGKYITFDETTKEITYSMPEGATLLVPYSLDNTSIGSVTSTVEGPSNSTLKYANARLVTAAYETAAKVQSGLLLPNVDVTYTLTVPAGSTLNVASGGKLVIGGTIAAGHITTAGVSCATAGAHSNMVLQQGATLNISGIASVCGYILGEGQVNVNSGGTVYQPYTLMDYRNGPFVISARDETNGDTFCFYRYTMQNIQSNIHMVYGASMRGYVDLFTATTASIITERHNVTEVDLISSTGLIRLNEDATLDISYDASRYATEDPTDAHYATGMYHRVGTTTMEFSGGMTFGAIELTISAMGITATVNSATDHFSVPYNYNIVLKNGTYEIPNKLKLMPGATMVVEKDATLLVSSGGELAIMTAARDHITLAASYDANAKYEFHYPSTEVLKAAPFNGNGSANLILNGGTLEVAGGCFGGLVQTTGTGSVSMAGTNNVTVHVGIANVTKLKLDLGMISIPAIDTPMTGKSLYSLTAQVYGTDGSLITLSSGKTYTAVDNVKNTVASYSYNVYTSNTSDTTTAVTDQPLNADVIGSWVVTGTEVPDRTLDFSASNVRLGNNLDMMFAFSKFQPDADVLSNYYVQIVHTYANGRIDIKEIPFSQWRETTVNDTACYYVTYSGIGAKNMGDTIRAMVFYRTVDGDGKVTNVGVSKIWEDSIRAYSERMLTKYSSTDYSHLQTLLGDMLNYGAACQLRFHYNTKYLANADFGNAGTTTNPTIDENLKNTTVGNDYWIGSNVIADSNTSFVVGFTTEFKEGMYFTYTFKNHWGQQVEETVDFSELIPVYDTDGATVKYYYYGLKNLRLADAYPDDAVSREITFCVYNSNGVAQNPTWTDSVLHYVARMTKNEGDIYMSLLKFANSAWKYLHEGKVVA